MSKAQSNDMVLVSSLYQLAGKSRAAAQGISQGVAQVQVQIDNSKTELENLSSSKTLSSAISRVVHAVKVARSIELPADASDEELLEKFRAVKIEYKKRSRDLIDEISHAGESKCRADRQSENEVTLRTDLTSRISRLEEAASVSRRITDELETIADESDTLFLRFTSGELSAAAAKKESDDLQVRFDELNSSDS